MKYCYQKKSQFQIVWLLKPKNMCDSPTKQLFIFKTNKQTKNQQHRGAGLALTLPSVGRHCNQTVQKSKETHFKLSSYHV